MKLLDIINLGNMRYANAVMIQQQAVEQRKQGLGCDTLFFVEHPSVITIGRNGSMRNVLASDEILARSGIEFFETNRGGDVTYHGPGQLVGYPVLDLREWKRDVHAFFHGVEQALIDTLLVFGVHAERIAKRGFEGVWVKDAKIAAIGIHISRWITSHGFALNLETNLDYFKYIVPCGLAMPVCSLRSLGIQVSRGEVMVVLAQSLASTFGYEPLYGYEARRYDAHKLEAGLQEI